MCFLCSDIYKWLDISGLLGEEQKTVGPISHLLWVMCDVIQRNHDASLVDSDDRTRRSIKDDLTNDRAANWVPEVAFSPFRALSHIIWRVFVLTDNVTDSWMIVMTRFYPQFNSARNSDRSCPIPNSDFLGENPENDFIFRQFTEPVTDWTDAEKVLQSGSIGA